MKEFDFNILKMEFDETSKLIFTFFEWRHKILTGYMVAISAILVAIQWMFSNNATRLIFVPFIFGVISSIVAALMDGVNQRILNSCYKVGLNIENKLLVSDGTGIFNELHTSFFLPKTKRHKTYKYILGYLYWGLGILFFLLSIISLFYPIK